MTKQVPLVDYLVLDPKDGAHLTAHECPSCGALYLQRRNACARCFSVGPFKTRRLAGTGTVRTFTIVQRAAPGTKVPFVSAVVEIDGGGYVKTNIVNTEPTPDAIWLGMPVSLTSFVVGTDDEGTEAVAFGFEPSWGEAFDDGLGK